VFGRNYCTARGGVVCGGGRFWRDSQTTTATDGAHVLFNFSLPTAPPPPPLTLGRNAAPYTAETAERVIITQ